MCTKSMLIAALFSAVLIAAQPVPKESCKLTLEGHCGGERKNRSLCVRCLDENKVAIDKAGCDYSEEALFCSKPAPKPETCEQAEEKYCGVDRHNETLCVKCAERNIKELEAHKCTKPELEKFCHYVPKPPAPSAKCEALLKKECEADKKNKTECAHCLREHHNQTKEADCTYKQLDEFCGIGPKPPTPPPAAECEKELELLCGKEKHNHTECLECAEEHRKVLEGKGCKGTEVTAFCKAHPAPPVTCPRALEKLCGEERQDKTKCAACVKDHAAGLKKDHCTEVEEEKFCKGTPAPPKPTAKCTALLAKECKKDEHKKEVCIECIRKDWNATKVDCSITQVEKFCNVTAPKPAPVKTTCRTELTKLCEAERKTKKGCEACIAKNLKTLEKEHCTAAEEAEFCPKKN